MNRATIKLVMSYTRQSLTGLESTMTCASPCLSRAQFTLEEKSVDVRLSRGEPCLVGWKPSSIDKVQYNTMECLQSH